MGNHPLCPQATELKTVARGVRFGLLANPFVASSAHGLTTEINFYVIPSAVQWVDGACGILLFVGSAIVGLL